MLAMLLCYSRECPRCCSSGAVCVGVVVVEATVVGAIRVGTVGFGAVGALPVGDGSTGADVLMFTLFGAVGWSDRCWRC